MKGLAALHIVRDLRNPPARLLDQAKVKDGAFDIGMFRSYWERAAKVTGERIADLSARPVPPSPEASGPTAPPLAEVADATASTTVSDDQLSTLAGLISKALESADALAASTRRRKANKGAPADVEATEPAAE